MTEKYRVYNKNGEFIREILRSEELTLKEHEWLKGVTCFVVNKRGEVLMEKRTNIGLTPGKIDICSGHVDGDEVYTQAMIRELDEELKIGLEHSINVISIENLDLKFDNPGTIKRNFLIQFYCLLVDEIEITPQKEEVAKYAWVPKKIAFEMIKQGKTKFPKDTRYEGIFDIIDELYSKRYMENSLSIISHSETR